MKTCVIYHRVDWDGYTSAAVALRAFPDAELIGWNYRDPLPDVDRFDRVILVDLTIYSLKPDKTRDFSWMINNQSKLIWIDHHPVIHDVPGEYMGIQREGVGACLLTWELFFDPDEPVPAHVHYAEIFDVFRKKDFDWEDAWAYQLYLNHLGSGYVFGEGDVSKKHVATASALIEASDVEMNNHLNDGRMFEYERSLREKAVFEKYAKYITVDGHAGWLIETMEQPSVIIKDHSDSNDGEVFILWHPDKKDKDGNYALSIRRSKDSDFDCRAFAKKHGGDGHVPAAGCLMSEEEIQSLL